MPGPIFRMASDSCDDLDAYESCEDVRETWRCTNGNFEGSDRFEECVEEEYHRKYTNGTVQEEDEEVGAVTMMHEVVVSERKRALLEEEEEGGLVEGGRRFARLDEELEEMECEEEGEGAVEAVNVSVVEAKMSVEFASALTRQKIASVQRGRTLSYADKDDVEEPPTRRPRPLAHARESMEIGSPEFRGSSVAEEHKLARRGVRVSRNPSYQAAMRGPATLSPPSQVTPPPSPVQLEQSSSCEGTPSREGTPATIRERSPSLSNNNNMNNNNNNNLNPTSIVINENDKAALSAAGDGAKRSATERAPPAPHGANMPRSASFSGSEAPALPDPRGSGSLSQGNSRAGSVSPLPSPSPRRSGSRLSGDEQPSTPVRGSVISRSFRRLFSTPSRSPQPQPQPPTVTTTAPPEDYRHDFSDADSPTPSDGRSSSGSRLRRISSSLSRRLSTRSKMSTSSTGSNGQGATNGSLQVEDCRQLVEYEDLLKLFICSGCQITMVPPLHQCRKGHLVCATCKLSLKQVCPVCRQRFADSTNLMMEQVCQLIKFPCRFSDQGCPEYHQPKSRPDHEHFCSYRPVHCHHGSKGCPKILRFKDMHQHLDECEYK